MKFSFPKFNMSGTHEVQIPVLIILSSLLLSILMVWTCKHNQQLEKITSNSKHEIVDTKTLQTKIVIPNRLIHFINYLNQHGAHLKSQTDFQIKTQDRNYRFQLSHQTKIDTNLILLHHELALLQNSGFNEIDAQFLHFAHRNYQNPFTGQTINPNILATSNPESILMDIQGFCAGNYTPIAQNYHINLATINSWIQSAQQQLLQEIYATNN